MILMAAVAAHVAVAQQAQSVTSPPVGATGALPDGSFTYTLMPDSSGNVKAAIDKTVADMNFIVRPIARGRLTKINPVPQRVSIRLGKDTVSASFDDGNPVITPLSGDTVPWSNPLTHETDHAHASVSGDTVRQTIAAPDGQRVNAFIFSPTGDRLHLVVTVTSHRLPRPLVYELLFRRDEAS